eukprot:6795505-Pyramimonas_sp.AAC.1
MSHTAPLSLSSRLSRAPFQLWKLLIAVIWVVAHAQRHIVIVLRNAVPLPEISGAPHDHCVSFQKPCLG